MCVDVSGVSRSRVTPSCGVTRAAPSPRPAGEPAAPAGGQRASEQVRAVGCIANYHLKPPIQTKWCFRNEGFLCSMLPCVSRLTANWPGSWGFHSEAVSWVVKSYKQKNHHWRHNCLIFRISKYSEILHQELCSFEQTPGVLNHQVQIYIIWRTNLYIHMSYVTFACQIR